MDSLDIVLAANSPGELSQFVRPVAQKFKERSPGSKIFLFLTPCQYSSGNEVEFAKKHLKVDYIISRDEYKKWLLGANLPQNITFQGKGIVLFLGGDFLHATIISKKLGYKAYAYLGGKGVSWTNFFSKFFAPKEGLFEKKIPRSRLIISGDLMNETIPHLKKEEARCKWNIDPKRPVIAMMPGSRRWEIECLLPIYEKIGKILKKNDPQIELMLIVSPFIPLSDIESYKGHNIFDVFSGLDSIAAADLVITIPGTNTAQIAQIGLPMVVIFPLDKPDPIPMGGMAYYITSIPILGVIIKRLLIKFINARTKYFALPNIIAKEEIVPEIRGKINCEKTAQKILNMLYNKEALDKTSQFLKYMMRPQNAAEKIVETIINENAF